MEPGGLRTGAHRRPSTVDDQRLARDMPGFGTDEKKDGLGETVFNPLLVEDRESMYRHLREKAIERPVMLVWGFNDPTAQLDLGYALFELLAKHQPRCQMHIVNQSGHHSFRERAPEFNRILTDFFEGVTHDA